MKTRICIFIFAGFLFFSCSKSIKHQPSVENGFLNLSGWDFERDGVVNLNGTWEFYWKKLYMPERFLQSSTSGPDAYISVPSSWRSKSIRGGEIPGTGYATYHAKVYLQRLHEKRLGLKMMDCYSSYILFINGKEVARNGIVADNPLEMKAQLLPKVVTFEVDSDSIDIVIQVANNFAYEGGVWQEIKLGTQNQIVKSRETVMFIQLFILGTFFILFVYHIWLFLFRKTELAAFWFGLICLFLIIRTLTTGERLLYHIFPNFPLYLGYKIVYFDFIMIAFSYLAFTYYLKLKGFPKSVFKFMSGIYGLLILIVLFTSSYIYTALLPFFLLVCILITVYLLITVLRNVSSKRPDVIILSIGFLIAFSCFINDSLFAMQKINTLYVAPIGFIFFLLSQAYVLAMKNSIAFSTIENLSIELSKANDTLEQKVESRTHELEKEKKKSDDLLLNILPSEIAEELKQTGFSKAKTYSMVTVMFTDFAGFTQVSEKVSAELLVAEIDYCFSAFDKIIQKYAVEKIKTVGDAYICAGGMPVLTFTHAVDTVNAAIEIRDFIINRKIEKEQKGEIPFELRIGIHTGPVVAGIVGIKKFAFDIWGDTVNIAARMESSGEPEMINISGATYELVKNHFKCIYRGKIVAKNKGEIDMYFVE